VESVKSKARVEGSQQQPKPRDQGELMEARACFEKALQIFKEKPGEDHFHCKFAQRQLGGICLRKKNA
jgi:hypothetical protein